MPRPIARRLPTPVQRGIACPSPAPPLSRIAAVWLSGASPRHPQPHHRRRRRYPSTGTALATCIGLGCPPLLGCGSGTNNPPAFRAALIHCARSRRRRGRASIDRRALVVAGGVYLQSGRWMGRRDAGGRSSRYLIHSLADSARSGGSGKRRRCECDGAPRTICAVNPFLCSPPRHRRRGELKKRVVLNWSYCARRSNEHRALKQTTTSRILEVCCQFGIELGQGRCASLILLCSAHLLERCVEQGMGMQ